MEIQKCRNSINTEIRKIRYFIDDAFLSSSVAEFIITTKVYVYVLASDLLDICL